MANFILIEPSCDIHLVLDPAFPTLKRRVFLRVFEATFDAALRRHQIDEVVSNLEFDFFPLSQAIVDFDDILVSLAPREGASLGPIHMQIRYLDPARPTRYHYLLVRILLHKKMNGWWFGNNSLSVFRDGEVAHSQPSIFALFDKDEPGGGVVGDITGHNYVDLSIDDTAICGFDTVFPGSRFKDRLRGLTEGTTTLRGSLLGQNQDIPLRVVDLKRDGTELIADLQREPIFNAALPRSEKFNVLFLSEGFTDTAEDKFIRAVQEVPEKLFDSERHNPYPLLKDSFNIWSRFQISEESGITCGPQLNQLMEPIPEDVLPDAGSPAGAYSLVDLIQIVGLPEPADAGRAIDDLKSSWNAGSTQQLIGYQNNLAVPNVVRAWKGLVPIGIPGARDSFYGLMQGARWGERESEVQFRDDMVAAPEVGDADFDAKHAKLAKRMYQWFNPNHVVRSLRFDPRRYAPEYRERGLNFLIDHIAKFADGSLPATDPNHHVGKHWNRDTPPDPAISNRQINSAGLVCLLIDHEYAGGTAQAFIMVRVTLARYGNYTAELNTADANIRRLDMRPETRPNVIIDHSAIADVVAHEFGHSFNLGDEYEEHRGPGDTDAEGFDNLTHVETIQIVPPLGGHSEDFPTPIDPEEIKWVKLHRIALAAVLVENSIISGNQITIKLSSVATDADRARWQRIKTLWQRVQNEHKTVFLRKYTPTNTINNQLPIEAEDLYTDLTIEGIGDSDGTLVLSGQTSPEQFPAGSVLYVPKRNVGNDPLTVIENAVLLYMRTARWNPGDNAFPLGVALSENHNKDAPNKSDPVPPPPNRPDNPPDIPGFDEPCKKYKVVGLYEGGDAFTTKVYRPAGQCKMRSKSTVDGEGEFCFVCKYLIVNRVDPSKHAVLDERYYPKQKKTISIGPLPLAIGDIV